jgi:uncharacterized protein (DUF362 family)
MAWTCRNYTRRQWLASIAAAGAGLALPTTSKAAPASRVAVARCDSYGTELLPVLETMFDQLGGVGRLVNNKTVAIKVNLTGSPSGRLGYAPAELTHFTHPAVIGAAVHLIGKAGAKRIRILEGCFSSPDPLEEFMMEANWNPSLISGAARLVEFENTNWLAGRYKEYARFTPPNGGYMYPGYDLSPAYRDCDVFVSIAKMKEHATAGVTLAMKNLFGITPITIYGGGAGEKEPSEIPRGGRDLIHDGSRQPSASSPGENPNAPKKVDGLRVPRAVADLVAARPVDLAIIDGIWSMNGGEGPWIEGGSLVHPGLLVAGANVVSTDAVGLALMGFDPMAVRGTAPFEHCDSTLALAEGHGVGSRDLARIEVVGAPIAGNAFSFRQRRRISTNDRG